MDERDLRGGGGIRGGRRGGGGGGRAGRFEGRGAGRGRGRGRGRGTDGTEGGSLRGLKTSMKFVTISSLNVTTDAKSKLSAAFLKAAANPSNGTVQNLVNEVNRNTAIASEWHIVVSESPIGCNATNSEVLYGHTETEDCYFLAFRSRSRSSESE